MRSICWTLRLSLVRDYSNVTVTNSGSLTLRAEPGRLCCATLAPLIMRMRLLIPRLGRIRMMQMFASASTDTVKVVSRSASRRATAVD